MNATKPDLDLIKYRLSIKDTRAQYYEICRRTGRKLNHNGMHCLVLESELVGDSVEFVMQPFPLFSRFDW